MSTITREGIQELITTYKNTYLENPAIMVSGYAQELQTVQDYEGRQLLELMQNADDAKSEVIAIELDTENHILTVANNGDQFSLGGVESLMYTGLSTKNKEEYIGNKGLGFRSILSWVNKVSILTKEISFGFSSTYSEQFYDQQLISNSKVEKRVKKEIESRKLSPHTKLIAALAFPEILAEKEEEYETKIRMDFKPEFLEKIQEQIEAISEELLLFLPNVKHIIVTVDGVVTKNFSKRVDEEYRVVINNSHWCIYRSPIKTHITTDQKINKYKFAIAWKEDLSITNGKFYTYFPTEVDTNLPCIIHATFDLNNSRKEINDTEANKLILNDIATALSSVTDKFIKKDKVDWDAYTFLTATSSQYKKVLVQFYLEINKVKENLGVYPTVDNQYALKNQVFYHGNEFSNWLIDNGFGQYFTFLLQAKEVGLPYISNHYQPIQFLQNIEVINPLLSLQQRVQLIGLLAKNEQEYFKDLHQSSIQLPLLLNNKGEIVAQDIRVFTKNTDGDQLEFPEYITDIEFISVQLYELIKITFNQEFEQYKKNEKESGDARLIKRFLDPVVNIGLDDITGVIHHIITETKHILTEATDKTTIVKSMVNSLYSIFRSNPDRRGNLSTISNIPLIAYDGSIQNSENLYFGNGYSIGYASTLIFEGIRQNSEYLAAPIVYNLEGAEENIVNFFRWLNVGLLSKEEEVFKKLLRKESDEFVNFVFKDIDNQREDVYKNYQVKTIVNIKKILRHEAFTVEKLIAWIAIDNKLYDELREENPGNFTVSFGPETKQISLKKSYLFFVINSSNILNNCILGNEYIFGNQFKLINPSSEFFQKLKVSEYKVLEIIDLLNIKKTINEFPPEYIYSMLKDFNNEEGKNSQTFYRLMYEYFRENETTQLEGYIPSFEELNYFARKGGLGKEFQLIPHDKVYYSDNKLLPQSILDNYWFINLPKRIGENRVAKFFGVNLIKEIVDTIEIVDSKEHLQNKELNQYLNKLKPYLLAYRLKNLSKAEDKKDTVNSLKKAQFRLVSKASFKTGKDDVIQLNDYDFIPKNDWFTLQFSKETSLDNLRKDPNFCDIIAELFCVIFKVGELKNTFRRIFKDGPKESLHILQIDEEEGLLQEAIKLLGISQEEINFWKKIFPSNKLEFDTDTEFTQALENYIGARLPEVYTKINFEEWNSNEAISFLRWINEQCKIELNDLITPIDIRLWHLNNIDNTIKDYLALFETILWKQANDYTDTDELKKSFYSNARTFEDAKDKIFDRLKLNDEVLLEVDYKDTIINYAKEQFNVDVQQIINEEIYPTIKYSDLISQYTFGISVEDMTKMIKDANISLYSLMFFEGFEEDIKDFCEQQQLLIKKNYAEEINEEDIEVLAIFEGEIIAGEVRFSNQSHGKSSSGSFTSKSSRQKAIVGQKTELKVKKSLESQGYLVNMASSKTDGFHYDLEYKKKDEIQWRKLEIKYVSGGYFFLSKDEKEKALNSNISQIYDVAIVNDNGVFLIKSMFHFEKDTFESNDKFTAEPTEYKIHFKLQN